MKNNLVSLSNDGHYKMWFLVERAHDSIFEPEQGFTDQNRFLSDRTANEKVLKFEIDLD